MPSKYRNFRNIMPWILLFLEAVLIILFYFLFSGRDAHVSTISYPGKIGSVAVKGRVNACFILQCNRDGIQQVCVIVSEKQNVFTTL